mgnify:CR=1 FL=1
MQKALVLLALCALSTAALATPPTSIGRLPEIVSFSVAYVKELNKSGQFVGTCMVEAHVPLKAKLYITANDGVIIDGCQRKHQLKLRPGAPFTCKIKGQLQKNAEFPTGVNLKLRYRLPMRSLKKLISSGKAPYKNKVVRDESLALIEEIETQGKKVREQNRCFLFDGWREQ